MLSCLVVSYTQRPSGFKAIIKSIFKTNLPSLTSAPLLPSFSRFFRPFFLRKLLKNLAKMKYICKKFRNHQIKKCLLFRCRHAVVIMQLFKLDQSVLAIHDSLLYFEISEDDHSWTVTHAPWWTLDFANAFLSPGANSRAELAVPRTALRAVGSGIMMYNVKHNY
jgi:hypothetical protein